MSLIQTQRLQLRKLTLDDLKPLYEILSDKETMKYYPSVYTMEMVKSWVQRSINSYSENGFGLWAVELTESGALIGQCGISLQNIDGQTVPEIGYHINKTYWRQGFATEAAKACMHYGFKTLEMESIYIHTYVKNVPSTRVAEKLGMQRLHVYDKYIKSINANWPHVVYKMDR